MGHRAHCSDLQQKPIHHADGESRVPEGKKENTLGILAEWLRLDLGCTSRPNTFEGAGI